MTRRQSEDDMLTLDKVRISRIPSQVYETVKLPVSAIRREAVVAVGLHGFACSKSADNKVHSHYCEGYLIQSKSRSLRLLSRPRLLIKWLLSACLHRIHA